MACRLLVVACELLVAACMWDLVPQPGIEPGSPALGARSLTHWTTREVPRTSFGMDTVKEQEHFSIWVSEEAGSGRKEVVLRMSLVRKQQSVK